MKQVLIEKRARDDPQSKVGLPGAKYSYGDLKDLPTLNGRVIEGDLTSSDVGLSAESLGLTAESLGISADDVARGVTPESLGMRTAGTAKVLATIFGD